MKFKITEVDTLKIKVEYGDGSWALIPTLKDADKAYYAKQIQDCCTTPQDPVPVKDLPYKLGDEGTVGDDVKEEKGVEDYDYGSARGVCYPTWGLQFDAMYHSRKGDNSFQEAIDGHIELVKAYFPKDDTIYTVADIEKALEELKKDAKWVAE